MSVDDHTAQCTLFDCALRHMLRNIVLISVIRVCVNFECLQLFLIIKGALCSFQDKSE